MKLCLLGMNANKARIFPIKIELTIEIASATSSLFLPATRPFKDSSASRSFFKRTCFSSEAASLSLA